MKRKAALKTLCDILKYIGAAVTGLFICKLVLWLYIMIPYWVLCALNLQEKYSDYPAGFVYGAELIIFLCIGIIIFLIKEIYLTNLKNLEYAEKEKNGKKKCSNIP